MDGTAATDCAVPALFTLFAWLGRCSEGSNEANPFESSLELFAVRVETTLEEDLPGVVDPVEPGERSRFAA